MTFARNTISFDGFWFVLFIIEYFLPICTFVLCAFWYLSVYTYRMKSDLWMMCSWTIKSHQATFLGKWKTDVALVRIWFGLSKFLLFNGQIKQFVKMVTEERGWGQIMFLCVLWRSRIFSFLHLIIKVDLLSNQLVIITYYVGLIKFTNKDLITYNFSIKN